MGRIVLSLFDESCIAVKPWAENGYKCMCIDLQHDKGIKKITDNLYVVGADILDYIPPRGDIAFAYFFPPCTDLAASGSRWFKQKGLHSLANAIKLFAVSVDIAESLECPYVIENPVSTISTYWRKPDYIFDPCDYGDPYTKKTCIWVGGGFKMPVRSYVVPTKGSIIHVEPGGRNQARERSKSFAGFTRAVYEANK